MKKIPPFKKRFPDNFSFGGSFISYQISGSKDSNWSRWETSDRRLHDLKQSGELEKYPLSNFICGDADRHDKRFKSDFNLFKKLGMNAICTSSEPGKIMPKKGVIDAKEIARIRKMVKHLNKIGIKPYWTLWHWVLPLWWEDEGGWESPDAVSNFIFYVKAVVKALAPLGVKNWITMNETNVFARYSYDFGIWPPQVEDPARFEAVSEALAQGHIAAYKIIKAICPDAIVGVAHCIGHNEITEDTAEQREWKERADFDWVHHFLGKIQDYQDFIGLNHYQGSLFGDRKNCVQNDLGWSMYPRDMYDTLMDVWNWYHKPIIITENGCADADDSRRPWFLWETLLWVHKAIEDGVPVFGYLHWSLMDNFEWAYGFWPRFGLIEIDREHGLKRKPRKSAYLYRDIIRLNGFSDGLANKYRDIIQYPKKNK